MLETDETMDYMDEAEELAGALKSIANAITPLSALPGHDSQGGYVSSLTEAVMSLSNAMNRIADAIEAHTESQP